MMSSSFTGSSVLVTGATGTFGNAVVPHLLRAGVSRLVCFSRDELKQSEMQARFPDPRIRWFIGDVRDHDRLRIAFEGITYIFHAAALKQIPVGEYNPTEFIATNVTGTQNVLRAAAECGVKKVLVISSDKASAPVTLYGATKNIAEHLARAGQVYNPTGTAFLSVRYGNVSGSRGSVIPIWRKMLGDGATELPVTHPGMTRFFFSIDRAVDFACWAMEHLPPGALAVPKMPSFYVTDLVKAMGADKFRVIGMRGVEKLHESMVSAEEARYFRSWQGRYVRFRDGDERGEALPDGFEYRSDRNDHWLSVNDLQCLLTAQEAAAA